MSVVAATTSSAFEVRADGSLVLELGETCIQTAARRAHRQMAQMLLDQSTGGTVRENALDTLGDFLTRTDFAALRAERPELAGGTPCRVRLRRNRDGSVDWEMIDTE